MKLKFCALGGHIDGKSSSSAFQQGVCQFSILYPVQRYDQKDKNAGQNDLRNFEINDLRRTDRRTDGRTDRRADGHISNSIDPRTLYARGSTSRLEKNVRTLQITPY